MIKRRGSIPWLLHALGIEPAKAATTIVVNSFRVRGYVCEYELVDVTELDGESPAPQFRGRSEALAWLRGIGESASQRSHLARLGGIGAASPDLALERLARWLVLGAVRFRPALTYHAELGVRPGEPPMIDLAALQHQVAAAPQG